jgi:hypothetical protein
MVTGEAIGGSETAYGRCNPWSNQWDNCLSYVYNLGAIITAVNGKK